MLENSLFLKIYVSVITVILGLIMGSFLNCAAGRILRGESIAKGRSYCESCGHVLGPLDLIPVFSWLFLKGKCRYCGQKIAARYPFTEFLCSLVYLAIVLKFGISFETLKYLILYSLLFLIALIDYDGYIIPDILVILGLINRLIFIFIEKAFPSGLLSALIGGLSITLPLLLIVLVMEKILKKEAMGGGDIKLLFMLGTFFDWKLNLLAMLFSCIIGIIFGFLGKSNEEKQFPFGPSICIAYFLILFIGSPIINFYLSLF